MEKYSINKLSKRIIYLATILLVVRCASQISPTGGEVDKIPPKVIEIYPPNGTVNYSENYFEVSFSEYVDKRTVNEAIFISPSIEGNIEYDWSGKTLTIIIEDSLKANTTYNISVGTDVKDLNNKNNMAESFNFAFSTGSVIDNGVVKGKVYNKDANGILIFAYKESEEGFANPSDSKPINITQVGKNGNYTLQGLSEGVYRIFAVRDDFKDLVYNIEDDEFGVPFNEIAISERDSLISDIDFMMTKEDTTLPHIFNITMTDKHHILIEFSEPIDSSKIRADNFYVYDSTSNVKVSGKYLYKGQAKNKELFLIVSDSVIVENQNYLVVEGLIDHHGNILDYEATQFTASDRPDTTAPALIKTLTEYDNNQVDNENAWIKFVFNDGFDTTLTKNIQIIDSKNNLIPSKVSFIDNGTISVKSKILLDDRSEYKMKINLKNIVDIAGNFLDSIYTYKFNTINSLQFSGVAGKVSSIQNYEKTYIVVKNIDSKDKLYKSKVDENFEFNFERVSPGEYLVWSFYDDDSNGVYSYGSIHPFKSSEKFVYYPDTLNLRARWPVVDVFINQ